MPDLSVVIVSFNTRGLLARCLTELSAAARGIAHEVIIVDNGSTDGTRQLLEEQPDNVRLVLNDDNPGFAAANNTGMSMASSPIVLLLNSDAFVTADTLVNVLTRMRQEPRIGLAGVQILNPDGSIQAESGVFPSLWQDIRVSIGLDQLSSDHSRAPSAAGPVDWVHGSCMFVRKAAFDIVGGMDERFFMYSEEVDWCRRFREHSWQVWYVPEVNAVHIGGASRSDDLSRRTALYQSRLGFRRRIAGPHSSLLLWIAMIGGLGIRMIVRPALQPFVGQPVGKQTAGSDWQLIRAIARMDPFARHMAS